MAMVKPHLILEEEVEKAIRRGGAWLRKQKRFAPTPLDLNDYYLTIGIFALLHAGEFERDPDLADRCTDYLLRRPLNTSHATYTTALTVSPCTSKPATKWRFKTSQAIDK